MKNKKNKTTTSAIIIVLGILLLTLLASNAHAMRNPSAVYCTALGYEYVVKSSEEGDRGYCKMPDNTEIDAWNFFLGSEGTEYNYCTKKGYETKIVDDAKTCERFLTSSCAVCVLKNGKEQEVSELMKLSFAETSCGDGNCGFPENHETCAEDCTQSISDSLCEQVKDDVCDPDCYETPDPDCPDAHKGLGKDDLEKGTLNKRIYAIIITIIIIAILIAAALLAKKFGLYKKFKTRKKYAKRKHRH